MRPSLSILCAAAACALAPTAIAHAQVSADRFFFEVDGDDGSVITENQPGDTAEQPADDINDGGGSTWGRRSTPLCSHWFHEDQAPYMGSQAYTVTCLAGDGVRSEQMIVAGWSPGTDSARSVSFAFRLRGVSTVPTAAASGFIAQLHQHGERPPPFLLKWRAVPGEGYRLVAARKYDVQAADGSISVRQPDLWETPITPGVWTRVMVQLDPGPRAGTGVCPEGAGDAGRIIVYVMDNATGGWNQLGSFTGQVGFRWWNGEDGDGDGQPDCMTAGRDGLQWKVGQYVVSGTNTLDYDSIAYGKRWNNITRNRLIGYQKSVLRLPFEELSGASTDDRSWTWNGGSAGDPVRDYGNDGTLLGGVTRIAGGVNGRALRFPGTTGSYVQVPIDPVDFDVGNYLTVSAWFRTSASPVDHKGLVMIDESSTSWKLLLSASRNGLSFGVRHPGTSSRLDHVVPIGRYADNQWHLVTGTYNRFAADGQRIKLYVDGVKVMEAPGNDLPVLRGNDRLTVGKFSVGGYFQGDLDDVGLFNYPMTDEDVESLWLERGAP